MTGSETSLPGIRPRAIAVVMSLGAVVLFGLVLAVVFDPSVQTIDATELVARSDDAKAFLIADYFFILLYAALLPIAAWRFGAASAASVPIWIRIGVGSLIAAGIVDLVENTLLLSAVDSVSEGVVDGAHDLVVPKIALFVGGAAIALVVGFRAMVALRGGRGGSAA